jgi:hypothetical protein
MGSQGAFVIVVAAALVPTSLNTAIKAQRHADFVGMGGLAG